MKYVIVDQIKNDGDIFTTECATLEEAIKEADIQFAYLTKADKKNRKSFYILESIDPDEESPSHLDGDIIKEYPL